MAGSVDLMFDQMYSAVPGIKGGKLRPLAITSRGRSPLLPEVPSFRELGFTQIEVLNWQGIVAPARTPADIVQAMHRHLTATLKMPGMNETLAVQGLDAAGGGPEAFGALIKSELAKYARVVKAAGIRAD